ncbi:hypothetical protein CLU79DRAFT_883050 [Phycomyces nitens]|nr:hypothetical protein CLU79DRAFT_883050 [Phycomyces nitens]
MQIKAVKPNTFQALVESGHEEVQNRWEPSGANEIPPLFMTGQNDATFVGNRWGSSMIRGSSAALRSASERFSDEAISWQPNQLSLCERHFCVWGMAVFSSWDIQFQSLSRDLSPESASNLSWSVNGTRCCEDVLVRILAERL